MAIVRRANVVLTIPDEAVELYLTRGYNLIDKDGKVVKEATPNDHLALRVSYIKHKEIIAELEAKVAELEAKVAELEAEPEAELAKVKARKKAKAEE